MNFELFLKISWILNLQQEMCAHANIAWDLYLSRLARNTIINLVVVWVTTPGQHDPTYLLDLAIIFLCQSMTHTSLWQMWAHANIAWDLDLSGLARNTIINLVDVWVTTPDQHDPTHLIDLDVRVLCQDMRHACGKCGAMLTLHGIETSLGWLKTPSST